MTKKLIAQGAEAKIYLNNETILKDRIKKGYRIPELDEKIRKSRTKREAKILKKAKENNIYVPGIISLDKFSLKIQNIKGDKLSTSLNNYSISKQKAVMKKLGTQTSKLHDIDIIHADLTTSNTILSKDNKVFIIDFGLSFTSKKIEDKAVDLHLIKQALEAKHFQNDELLFKEFLTGYKPKDKTKIIERLKIVEKRGRYKH